MWGMDIWGTLNVKEVCSTNWFNCKCLYCIHCVTKTSSKTTAYLLHSTVKNYLYPLCPEAVLYKKHSEYNLFLNSWNVFIEILTEILITSNMPVSLKIFSLLHCIFVLTKQFIRSMHGCIKHFDILGPMP